MSRHNLTTPRFGFAPLKATDPKVRTVVAAIKARVAARLGR